MRAALAVVVAVFACSPPAAPRTPATGNRGPSTAGGDAPPVGTAAPITIEATDPDGRWVVACQARKDTDGDGAVAVHLGMHGDTYGDAMAPYLIVGGGAGDAIDAFLDSSRDGAWIAAVAGGTLVLIDGATGHRTTLADADLRDDDYPTLSPRAAAFAGAGRLVFMRHRTGGDVVVSRELATGRETEIAVPGAVWRVEPDPGGAWARVLTIRSDSDKSGALEWPSQHTSLSSRGCRGPITSYSSFGADGDEPDTLWVALGTGQVVDDASVVAVAGPDLVRVTKDKALAIGDAVVLPAGCDPAVVATSADPPRVVAGCGTTAAGTTKLVLAGGTATRDLGIEVERGDGVRRLAPGDRLACVDRAACVDVATGTVHKGEIAYVDGGRLLVTRGDRYVVVDGGTDTPLGSIEGYLVAASGPVLAIGHTVVDLAAARRLGTVDGEIAAVDRAGRALVTTKVADETPGPDLPAGPARWVTPK